MTDFATLRQRKTEMIDLAATSRLTFDAAEKLCFTRWLIQAGKLSDQPPCSVLARPSRIVDWK